MTELPEAARWQGMLDRHGALFGDLDDNCRIGIARRADIGPQGARRW